jgi:protocatechuate 3,4-dioxygenase beta subunit
MLHFWNEKVRVAVFRNVWCVALIAMLAACSGQTSATPTAVPPQAPQVIAPAPSTTAAQPTTEASATTPNCTPPIKLTSAQTEGPYFKAGSPEQASLITANMPGTKLVLTGYVFTTDCQPIAHALLDFWQADASGNYDNNGYTLRGHQYTDSNGRYQLTSIIPGLYPGRTEHIHVKVQATNGPILTTQLYFPGVSQNDSDGIFDPKMIIALETSGAGQVGSFNFVVKAQ